MSDSHEVQSTPADDPPPDPEIVALLDFEPVVRLRKVQGEWTPELQREFIARLAVHGSPGRSAEEMGKTETGVRKLYRSPLGASFRAAWDAAIALARRRKSERAARDYVAPGSKAPSIDNRRKDPHPGPLPRLGAGEGQVLNEFGEWEDEESLARRAEDARDRVTIKLLRARRLFLHDISEDPAMRAAFEILTELPVDWERAAALQPQADEPWRKPSMREPAMLLAAEAGWLGEFAHGPDKKAELLKEINEWRAERGLEPVGWRGEEE